MHYFLPNMHKLIQLRMYKTVRCTKKAKSYNFFIFFNEQEKRITLFSYTVKP